MGCVERTEGTASAVASTDLRWKQKGPGHLYGEMLPTLWGVLTLCGLVIPGLLFSGHDYCYYYYFSSKSCTRLENWRLLCGKGSGHLAGGTVLAGMARGGRGAHAQYRGVSPILLAAEHFQPQLRSVAKRRICIW